MEPIDYKAVAAQLANPTGEDGIRTAQFMHISNADITRHTIDLLDIGPHMRVLEIGPGNGKFAGEVVGKSHQVSYVGVDISRTMVEEARRLNQPIMETGGSVEFRLNDGLTLPFDPGSFDRIFSVNTIYFWTNPVGFAREILRVLIPGGRCCLALASRSFMQQLPFTDERFQLYDTPEVVDLLSQAGFSEIRFIERTHPTTSANKNILMREEVFVLAERK